jgi:nicotinate-nucleotide pyrophosphorylase
VTTEEPDRSTILAAVMPALLTTQAWSAGESDSTGDDTVVATSDCIVVGLPVAREAFGRLGARCRGLVDEGTPVGAGQVVAELGGPLAAIHRAAPIALAFLARLSAVASGVHPPDPIDELERYAVAFRGIRLSPSAAVDDDGPSFRLGSEG